MKSSLRFPHWVLTLLLFLAAYDLLHANANVFYERGANKRSAGDLEGALKDFSMVIHLAPDFPFTYNDRAGVWRRLGKSDNAIADYSKAIELKPNFAEAIANRGILYAALGQRDLAIADFTRVIDLGPAVWQSSKTKIDLVYYSRSRAYFEAGNSEQAFTDIDRAIQIHPKESRYYAQRGYMKHFLSDYVGARTDYDEAIKRGDGGYYLFFRYFIDRKLNESSFDLPHALTEWKKASPWAKMVGQFLIGKITETEFLEASRKGSLIEEVVRQACEANYYCGMQCLLADDRSRARRFFEDCIATKQERYLEYRLANGELSLLNERKL